MSAKKDNSTFRLKRDLRIKAIASCENPVVLEAYAGAGLLFESCYRGVQRGVAFEADEEKAEIVARQRPSWSVYCSDCVSSIQEGAGGHLKFNFLDFDPYGSPFPAIKAAMALPLQSQVQLVVNDGLRNKVRVGGAWHVECLRPIVEEYGSDLFDAYMDVARTLIERIAGDAGYSIAQWTGYHCGHCGDMTHYWATLSR